MSTKRVNRVSSEIQKYVSEILIKDIDSKELKLVTISGVNVSPDLNYAKIFYTTMLEKEKEDAGRAFAKYKKDIRKILSTKLRIKATPELTFIYDNTLDNAYRIDALINKTKN